ncbi:hypothetical protein COU17_01090 [Candidatus Kaiserbacteria bacterium CG10_big_fil_rev_8_21_14_0_10_49_17]|uniref:DUF5671 domain-containing protein n=1 Tax=Candidatus Kaiserbacteria bacterium CG10_big_fil_rev_8_21_14_0_10_49_17 TaxID=1974609 RepID=A0A2M6WF05_9BACT|nr:MAG: hypothetical protein COU17_01090 [Candidatus Kaiserbacteria bacterium CG10_big_fil_rev_8_21_14_0_10_49_17]
METIPQKKFSSIWEALYFFVSIAGLFLLSILFIIMTTKRVGTEDLVALFFFYTLPWLLWSLWAPFLFLKAYRQARAGSFFALLKMCIYGLSALWLLVMATQLFSL